MPLPAPQNHTLIVLGCAPGAPESGAWLAERIGAHDMAAVNAAGLFWPRPLTLWCSYHYEHMLDMVTWRTRAGLPMEHIHFVLDVAVPGLDATLLTAPHHGGSAMLAVHAGLLMGYPRIILAGVEIPDREHYAHFRPGWQEFARTADSLRVRSVSGWTAELLGKPEL